MKTKYLFIVQSQYQDLSNYRASFGKLISPSEKKINLSIRRREKEYPKGICIRFYNNIRGDMFYKNWIII